MPHLVQVPPSFCLFKKTKNSLQVIGLRDVIPPPLRREFSDVYIATELMDTDLHQIIRSNQGLSEDHCQVNPPPKLYQVNSDSPSNMHLQLLSFLK